MATSSFYRCSEETLQSAIKRCQSLLPFQGPIKDFIHRNMLPGLQSFDFHAALLQGHQQFQAKPYMPLSFYREQLQLGRLHVACLEEHIQKALQRNALQAKDNLLGRSLLEWLQQLLLTFDYVPQYSIYKHLVDNDYHKTKLSKKEKKSKEDLWQALDVWIQKPSEIRCRRHDVLDALAIDLSTQANKILYRLISMYLDQGLSLWVYPDASGKSFYASIVDLAATSVLPVFPEFSSKDMAPFQHLCAKDAVLALIEAILYDPNDSRLSAETYFVDTLLLRRGWSTMIAYISQNANCLRDPRNIDLVEWLAVCLWVEYALMKHYQIPALILDEKCLARSEQDHQVQVSSWAWFLWQQNTEVATLQASWQNQHEIWQVLSTFFDVATLSQIFQHAYEDSYYQGVSHQIQHRKKDLLTVEKNIDSQEDQIVIAHSVAVEIQAFFCIDDRECSLRRHLENLCPYVQTFATAGFYGLDSFVQTMTDANLSQRCPAPIKPNYLIQEVPKPGYELQYQTWLKQRYQKIYQRALLRSGLEDMFWSFIQAAFLGIFYTWHLWRAIFWPEDLSQELNMADPQIPSVLKLLSQEGTFAYANRYLALGYTFEEMTQRVAGVLLSSGLKKDFAPLVVLYGHGSSSMNNPQYAAYGCGACSGASGNVNSRAFAWMANHSEVRARLLKQEIVIPDSTVFIGAYHDTTSDEVVYYLEAPLSEEQKAQLQHFQKRMLEALGLNAQQRCQHFTLLSDKLSVKESLQEVKKRSRALFEPRFELGHTGNAITVVGPRGLTKGINLQRRAFLQSYDYRLDADGLILQDLLLAVVPVCAGINLDYYFSRVDPQIYGSGSKLPHNVSALIGVINGMVGDLLQGLPWQAVEQHEPVRMLFILEQTPEVVDKVFQRAPQLAQWIKNSWAHVCVLHPQTAQLQRYSEKDGWQEILCR